MNTNTTEQFLQFLAERRAVLRNEKWYWSYRMWRQLRGYTRP